MAHHHPHHHLLKRTAGDADLSSVNSDNSDGDDCDDDSSSLFDGSSGDATIRPGGSNNAGSGKPPGRSNDRKRRRGVIEKRRRDRINNSLIELRRLVPQAFEKQGNAKLEKAEILQLTVDYLRDLHHRQQKGMLFADPEALAIDYRTLGFRECMAEVARYLSLAEGLDTQDPMRLRLLTHLQCFAANCAPASTPPLPASSVPPMMPTGPQHSSTPRLGMPPVAHQAPQWAQDYPQQHFNGSPAGSAGYNPATPEQSPAGQPNGFIAQQPQNGFHGAPTPNAASSVPSPYNPSAFMGGAYGGNQQYYQQQQRNDASVNPKWCQLISAGLAAAYDTAPLSAANDNHPTSQAFSQQATKQLVASAMANENQHHIWQSQQQLHHQAMLNAGLVKPEQLQYC